VAGIQPVVRYLIVCQDIIPDPADARRLTLVNLISAIRSQSTPLFPSCHAEFCVLVQLTECRGISDVRLDVVQADTDTAIFQTRTRSIPFGNEPLQIVNLYFRIRNCTFPTAGLYWVQFWYNGVELTQQPIVLR
jgi:hypothetical protein